jgi:transposase
MMTMTRTEESTAVANSVVPTLLLALELGERTWKLGFSMGLGQPPRIRQMPAGATARLLDEIAAAKVRFKLPADAAVVSCYEVGREAFWVHRWLIAHAVDNHVIDSSSIEVNRRARRAKTDRLDLGGLLNLLARHQLGDRRVWRTVRVPSREEEDARQLHRTRETLQQDRNRLINRLKGLMTTQGLALAVGADFLTQLDTVRLWDGTPIPAGLKARLQRAWAQLESLNTALEELDAARAARAVDPQTTMGRYLLALPTLRGIGPVGTWTLTTELFGWRQITNRRQLGALVGLVPAPYQSGERSHDQGITRAGNRHVRRVMVQLAWGWLRYQPDSALTQWYQRKFGSGSGRLRRIGIVALARKLLIALWRYVEHGEIPAGAIVKDQAA